MMIADTLFTDGLNWILTYLLHSTILLSGAWLVVSLISSRYDAIRESLLRFALIGGLFTASVQVVLNPSSWASRYDLPSALQIDIASWLAQGVISLSTT
ncbi:MAG: hypothetical protein O7G85_17390, partial [Planctomycetota bacterium]|nr:hypothetical protein [Planctomycetota bacterium]